MSDDLRCSRHQGRLLRDAADVITIIRLEMKGSSCSSWTTGLIFPHEAEWMCCDWLLMEVTWLRTVRLESLSSVFLPPALQQGPF